MTLTLVSGVWLEQASMTDTPKFGPSVCLAARISANPNKELTENIDLYAHLTEGDLNYDGALHKCTAQPSYGDLNPLRFWPPHPSPDLQPDLHVSSLVEI